MSQRAGGKATALGKEGKGSLVSPLLPASLGLSSGSCQEWISYWERMERHPCNCAEHRHPKCHCSLLWVPWHRAGHLPLSCSHCGCFGFIRAQAGRAWAHQAGVQQGQSAGKETQGQLLGHCSLPLVFPPGSVGRFVLFPVLQTPGRAGGVLLLFCFTALGFSSCFNFSSAEWSLLLVEMLGGSRRKQVFIFRSCSRSSTQGKHNYFRLRAAL